MSDDPDRKKSLREQVEEYKRLQKQAEEKKAKAGADGGAIGAGGAKKDDDDIDDDDDLDDDVEDDGAEWTSVDRASATAEGNGVDVVKIVSTVFLGVGLVLLLVSATIFWFTRQSIAGEATALGVVVQNVLRTHTSRPSGSSRDVINDYYHAVVEFPLKDGTKKTVEMSEGNWPKAYEEGEKVTVRYDPNKPLKARLGGGGPLDFIGSLITGFLGAVFTAVAIGIRRAFA
ncbi:MAG: DUF3592 domain-containing protein [Vicinamibacteria bacterium]